MKNRPKPETPVVTVVIPACNAQQTLADTLESALAQTCRDIEILVVDDGSSDQSASIAKGYAARDGRVRLIEQANGGVARARNRGVAEARGAYIAPLDADDLWHPAKLERQLRALEAAGPNVGLAYSWSRLIDAEGRVTGALPPSHAEGYVLHRHLAWNFIGNGSTPLFRAELLRDHLYDPSLRDAHCEGGEDYLLQLRLARRYAFVRVPGYLIGYRKTTKSMSSNILAMTRSVSTVFAMLDKDLSGFSRDLARKRRAEYLVWEAGSHLGSRDWPDLARTLVEAGRCDPSVTMKWMVDRALKRSWRKAEPSSADEVVHFFDKDPDILPECPEPKSYVEIKSLVDEADRREDHHSGYFTIPHTYAGNSAGTVR